MPDQSLSPVAAKIKSLALGREVPRGLPIPQDDWDAMDTADRTTAVQIYVGEMEQSMVGIKPEFPKITTPTGGALAWVMPDGSSQKELEGIVVFHAPARSYYESDEITGARPDCSSQDGHTPVSGAGPTGAKTCAECPHSLFGSGKKGRGQACKERLILFLWLEGQQIPSVLALPPTGIRPFSRYVTALVNTGKVLVGLTTVLTLERKQGAAAPYAVVAPRLGRALTWHEMKTALAVRERFKDEMARRGITEAEITEPDEPGAGDDPPPRGDTEKPITGPGDAEVPF
jgi:hypothetical protein